MIGETASPTRLQSSNGTIMGCVKIQTFSGSSGFGATEISMGFPNAKFGVVKNTDVPNASVEAQEVEP